jgi:hypothetical protein
MAITIDITSRIERLEVFEERSGVRLESLSAFVLEFDSLPIYVTVRGELQARDGTELQQDVELVIAAYDSSGRIVDTRTIYYYKKNFFGLETFDEPMMIPVPVNQLAKVRVYPKKV